MLSNPIFSLKDIEHYWRNSNQAPSFSDPMSDCQISIARLCAIEFPSCVVVQRLTAGISDSCRIKTIIVYGS